jgi:hypothetical protein
MATISDICAGLIQENESQCEVDIRERRTVNLDVDGIFKASSYRYGRQ